MVLGASSFSSSLGALNFLGIFDAALFGFIFVLAVSFLDDEDGRDLSGRMLILLPSSSVSKYLAGFLGSSVCPN